MSLIINTVTDCVGPTWPFNLNQYNLSRASTLSSVPFYTVPFICATWCFTLFQLLTHTIGASSESRAFCVIYSAKKRQGGRCNQDNSGYFHSVFDWMGKESIQLCLFPPSLWYICLIIEMSTHKLVTTSKRKVAVGQSVQHTNNNELEESHKTSQMFVVILKLFSLCCNVVGKLHLGF